MEENMKKKFGFVKAAFVLLTALCVFAACGGNKEAASGGGNSGKKRVVLLSKGNMDVFVKNISDAFLARAEELKDKVDVTVLDAGGDMAKQLQQAEDAITQKYDAIVLIAVDFDGSAPIVDQAIAAGIPIIGDNTTTNNTDKITYVGSDDVDAGKIQGEFLKTVLKPGARVCYLMGPMGVSPQIFRKQGIEESLFNDPAMKIQVLEEQTANWSRAEAMSLTETWLAKYSGNIDAVICQNDDMAMGALEAIEAKGLKSKIVVAGVDAIDDAKKAVKAGRLDATVFQDAAGQGRGGLDAALECLEKGVKRIPDVWIPFKAVTKDNVDQFM
jgi:ABC-type sugar transport system substrate-binding protein